MEVVVRTNLVGVESVRRLRRSEYDALVDLGMLEREPVELIRGVIVQLTRQGPQHDSAVQTLTEALVVALLERGRVRCRLPLIASDDSEPEPDLAVVPLGDYTKAHPDCAHLVIEVASTSQAYDRGTKAPLYAAMGVPQFWLVDVAARCIEVHRSPGPDGYRERTTIEAGSVAVDAFPDVTVALDAVMPA
jgi:Uma2 family endonuclease